jgi:hypothetical protein
MIKVLTMQEDKASKLTRRKFLATSARVVWPALGASASEVFIGSAPPASREIGAWLLVSPKYPVRAPVISAPAAEETVFALAMHLACDFPPGPASVVRFREWRGFFTADPGAISNGFAGWGGSTARTLLLKWSAWLWSVPGADLIVEQGVITHPTSSAATHSKITAAASNRFEHFFWAGAGDEEFPMELLTCETGDPFVAFSIIRGEA